MLIPEDLTVKELKTECLRHTNCGTCKYEDSCAGEDPSKLKINQNYPDFTEQEIGILNFYYERGFNKVWFNTNTFCIIFEAGQNYTIFFPSFLMSTIAKNYKHENKFDIKQYLDWYESNHN